MSTPEITLIAARRHELGSFSVDRVLPRAAQRRVGPFVFLDHFGPVARKDGGPDVPPHPHIGLSTLTYLFEGEALHRDSLGRVQPIRPGEVNWMTAGRGIAHSERPVPSTTGEVHGLQFWVALPTSDEDALPSFDHHGAGEIPVLDQENLVVRLVAGTVSGVRSPVAMRSHGFLLDARASGRAKLELPTEHEHRAIYVIAGDARLGMTRIPARTLAVIPKEEARPIEMEAGAHVVVFGGAPLDGPRYIWWNFVSSRQDRIQEAARLWREGRFPPVIGDPGSPVPLEDEPHFRQSQPPAL
jgi:redox-sensitive bicupin YhaK (pirin superfamily)